MKTNLREEPLAHFGVKGMRWGVRKSETLESNLSIKSSGVKVSSDGSIEISKGASLQRLVRSNGTSLPMKDITYASLTDYDNSRYVKTIGGKGFFGGGRDQILGIEATKTIKAPSKDEATRIVSDLFLSDSKFRSSATNMLENQISNKELEQIRKDPSGKVAKAWYDSVNTSLTFDADFDPGAPYVQASVSSALFKKGYNAVRDENDFNSGIAKAPIIIFKPELSLKVTSTTNIDDALRAANKEKLKQYKALGKDWVERELYDS